MKSLHTSTLRLLLAVLLVTFISPGFAWQMIVGHGEDAPAPLMSAAVHADDVNHHHYDGASEDDNAHGQIGHLLSHLPTAMFDMAWPFAAPAVSTAYPVHVPAIVCAAPPPPYKPPRSLTLI